VYIPYLHTIEYQSYKLMEYQEYRTRLILDALSDLVRIRYANLLVNVPLPLRLNAKMVHYNIHDCILPYLKICPFKSQVPAA